MPKKSDYTPEEYAAHCAYVRQRLAAIKADPALREAYLAKRRKNINYKFATAKWKRENPERVKELNKQSYEKNKDDIQVRRRVKLTERLKEDPFYHKERALKSNYGIGMAEYNALLTAQGGGCAICGATESGNVDRPMLFVDHCHTSTNVRGLLCHYCNLGLGGFKDSVQSLINAVGYLNTHKDKP